MKKRYRVTNGCSKCAEDGHYDLTEEGYENWRCQYGDPCCSAKNLEYVSASWLAIYKRWILLTLSVLAVWLVASTVTKCSKSQQLSQDFNKLQRGVDSWTEEVAKAPTNRGLGSLATRLWVARFDRKKKAAEEELQSVDGEKALEDLKKRIETQLEEADAIAVPKFEPAKPLAVYGELTQSAQKLGSEQAKLAREARTQNKVRQEKDISELKRQIDKGRKVLREKRQPPPDVEPPDGPKLIAAYKKALAARLARVEADLKQAREDAERERKRLADLEVQRKIEEEKRTEKEKWEAWDSPEVQLYILCEQAPLRKSLVEHLVHKFIAESTNGQVARPVAHPEQPSQLKVFWKVGAAKHAIALGVKPPAGKPVVHFSMSEIGPPETEPQVIALDAMIALAHPGKGLRTISEKDLEGVIGGRITTWEQLGSGSGRISLVLPSRESSESLTLPSTNSVGNINTAESVAESVSKDPSSLGVTSFHFRAPSRSRLEPLEVSPASGTSGIAPAPFSIQTEDYRFSRRVFAHTPKESSKIEREFLKFILGDSGQKEVQIKNYVDLRLQKLGTDLPSELLPIIGNILGTDKIIAACRLSTNFRFALDSDQLDLKASGDIERVQNILMRPSALKLKCLVVGFADSQGSNEYNRDLSKNRARTVEVRLEAASRPISPTYRVGLGETEPVGDNETEQGRAKNRRVEIWLVETQ